MVCANFACRSGSGPLVSMVWMMRVGTKRCKDGVGTVDRLAAFRFLPVDTARMDSGRSGHVM